MMMIFLAASFIAGVLTVLSPCVLPLLPVIVGTSASGRGRATPYVVTASLAASVIAFTYLLKVSSAFIAIPPAWWLYFSGGVVTFFGITLVFPALYERLPLLARVSSGSNKLIGAGYRRQSAAGDILIGAALGPVFSSCSPTYFIILASVLPASFARGSAYLLAYVLGMALLLLGVALVGERLAGRLGALSNPYHPLKRGIGILFIALGIAIATGYEKELERAIPVGRYFDTTKLEQKILPAATAPAGAGPASPPVGGVTITRTPAERYHEIEDPAGFVNTGPITIGSLVGKKVILVDFMTYSCINCQRTFPYLTAWYRTYKDQGFEIVGIHTPEFAFEKNIDNVREAMKRFGITYPVVLDNNYATWRAYGNQYWPRKYLIDIHGNIVYDHIGEGGYEETEMKIRELLDERRTVLGLGGAGSGGSLAVSGMLETASRAESPETYFGSSRNVYLANGQPGRAGEQDFTLPDVFLPDALYLGGAWRIAHEYAASVRESRVVYRYRAKEVYIVADADTPVVIEVRQDGQPVGIAAGADVSASGEVVVRASRLYRIIRNADAGEHVLELRIKGTGLRIYTFTFG